MQSILREAFGVRRSSFAFIFDKKRRKTFALQTLREGYFCNYFLWSFILAILPILLFFT